MIYPQTDTMDFGVPKFPGAEANFAVTYTVEFFSGSIHVGEVFHVFAQSEAHAISDFWSRYATFGLNPQPKLIRIEKVRQL